MTTYQSIQVLGYAASVTIRQSGQSDVLSFSLSKDNGYVDRQSGQWVERDPTWHKVTKWDPTDTQKRIQNGDHVFVAGTVSVEQWETRDGVPRADLAVKAYQVARLSTKAMRDWERSQRGDAPATQQQPSAPPDADMGEPPW